MPGPARPPLPDHAHALRARSRHRQRAHRDGDRPGLRHLLRPRPQGPAPRGPRSHRTGPHGARAGAAAADLMLGRYRDTVRAWSDPFGRVLLRVHLRPNHLTVAGLAASLVAAGCFIAGQTRTAGLVLILAGLLDLLDGSLARAPGQVAASRGVGARPGGVLCLTAGALRGVRGRALWVLAGRASLTAVQRIAFARRMMRAAPRRARGLLPLGAAARLRPADVNASADTARAHA